MQDYANVDQDYDDTITSTELDVYERFTPQPVGTTAAPVTSTHQVPISKNIYYVYMYIAIVCVCVCVCVFVFR